MDVAYWYKSSTCHLHIFPKRIILPVPSYWYMALAAADEMRAGRNRRDNQSHWFHCLKLYQNEDRRERGIPSPDPAECSFVPKPVPRNHRQSMEVGWATLSDAVSLMKWLFAVLWTSDMNQLIRKPHCVESISPPTALPGFKNRRNRSDQYLAGQSDVSRENLIARILNSCLFPSYKMIENQPSRNRYPFFPPARVSYLLVDQPEVVVFV
jgi:hypothetical protein